MLCWRRSCAGFFVMLGRPVYNQPRQFYCAFWSAYESHYASTIILTSMSSNFVSPNVDGAEELSSSGAGSSGWRWLTDSKAFVGLVDEWSDNFDDASTFYGNQIRASGIIFCCDCSWICTCSGLSLVLVPISWILWKTLERRQLLNWSLMTGNIFSKAAARPPACLIRFCFCSNCFQSSLILALGNSFEDWGKNYEGSGFERFLKICLYIKWC